MMRYMWDEEAHQKFLRMKHPNYYAMDHEEHKRKFEEARDRAVREAVERALFRSRMTTTPDPVIKQETIDVDCEIISSTLTHNKNEDDSDRSTLAPWEKENLST